MKITLKSIVLLIAISNSLYSQSEIEIYRDAQLSADGLEIQTSVSLTKKQLDSQPQVNLLLEKAPFTAEEAIQASVKAFKERDPSIEHTLVQKVELIQAEYPEAKKDNFFIGMPLYVVDIHGFRVAGTAPQVYLQRFVVLPDKSVMISIAKK